MECAYCGKKIGMLRSLQHAEFCSAAHQKAYLKKQEALALDFLMQNKPHHTHEVPQAPPVEPAPPPAPRPLPPAAFRGAGGPLARRGCPETWALTHRRRTSGSPLGVLSSDFIRISRPNQFVSKLKANRQTAVSGVLHSAAYPAVYQSLSKTAIPLATTCPSPWTE